MQEPHRYDTSAAAHVQERCAGAMVMYGFYLKEGKDWHIIKRPK